MSYSIVVLLHPDEITLMHTVYPLLRSRRRSLFRFTTDPSQVLREHSAQALCIIRLKRLIPSSESRVQFLSRAREHFRRLVIIDNNASTGAVLSRELELCDLYYKRSLYADRSLYRTPIHSGRLFVDYYARSGRVESTHEERRLESETSLHKLRVLWNLGIGSYPRSSPRKAAAIWLSGNLGIRTCKHVYADPRRHHGSEQKDNLVSARFATDFRERGVSFHRSLFESAARADHRFRTGKAPLRVYNRELRTARGVLSPFGFGEECFRDFEAVVNGAVCIKPDMSHVETWPDVYRPDETYLPCSWDATDVASVADRLFSDAKAATLIARRAREVLEAAYRELDERVESFVSETLDDTV